MKRIDLLFASLAMLAVSVAAARALGSPQVQPAPSISIVPDQTVATELEWVPTLPGIIEQTLRKVLPPVQPSESPAPTQPTHDAKIDLLLPSESPSLNLNSNGNGAPDANSSPPALIVPPIDTVPPARVPELSGIRAPTEIDTNLKPQPEDATMKGIKFAMSALVGAALLGTPAAAADPKEMDKSVERLEAAIKRLESVEKSLTDYKISNAAAVRQVQDDIESLKSKVQQLADDLKLARQAGDNPSTSKRDTSDSAPKMGRIRLSNEYNEEMSIVVNGKSYRLLPGQSRTIKVPAGVFTYQVLQLQRNEQERTIAADEERPIRIYTQQ